MKSLVSKLSTVSWSTTLVFATLASQAIAAPPGVNPNSPFQKTTTPTVTKPSSTTPSVINPAVTTPSTTTLPAQTTPTITTPSATTLPTTPSATTSTVTEVIPKTVAPAPTTPSVTVPTTTVPSSTKPATTTPATPTKTTATATDKKALATRLVLVLGERRVYAYQEDKVLASYPVAVGKKGWETPTGNFKVIQKVKDPIWQNPWNGKIVPASLNGPIGIRWIGFWTDGKNTIGFHGTPGEHLLGQAVSHGCVRMKNKDVVALFEMIEPGTPVIVKNK